jgi:hypothetical protein
VDAAETFANVSVGDLDANGDLDFVLANERTRRCAATSRRKGKLGDRLSSA